MYSLPKKPPRTPKGYVPWVRWLVILRCTLCGSEKVLLYTQDQAASDAEAADLARKEHHLDPDVWAWVASWRFVDWVRPQ